MIDASRSYVAGRWIDGERGFAVENPADESVVADAGVTPVSEINNAIEGARRNGITNAHFFAGDTRNALPELLERAGRADVIVVDPPRAGLSKKVVHRIVEASPRRIVYVSCNPTTLAPNAAELARAGWALKKVRPVDMFPQTHHIESVALLERG